MRLDRLDEARQELESLRNDASVRDEADLRLGKLAYLMGDMAEAGRRFGSLISLATGGAGGVLLSVVHRRTRGPHRSCARGLFQAGRSRRRPDRAWPRGPPAAQEGRARRGIPHARRARREGTRPKLLDVEFAKAALLEDSGSSTEAIALLQLALERYPDHPGVRYQIALIQDKAGHRARIGAQFRKPAQGSALKMPACSTRSVIRSQIATRNCRAPKR